MPKLPVITATQLLRALHRYGFIKVGQRGSHIKLRRGELRVIVPFHKGKTLPPKTMKAILDDAELSVDQLISLL